MVAKKVIRSLLLSVVFGLLVLLSFNPLDLVKEVQAQTCTGGSQSCGSGWVQSCLPAGCLRGSPGCTCSLVCEGFSYSESCNVYNSSRSCTADSCSPCTVSGWSCSWSGAPPPPGPTAVPPPPPVTCDNNWYSCVGAICTGPSASGTTCGACPSACNTRKSDEAFVVFNDKNGDGVWDYDSGEERLSPYDGCLDTNTIYLFPFSLYVDGGKKDATNGSLKCDLYNGEVSSVCPSSNQYTCGTNTCKNEIDGSKVVEIDHSCVFRKLCRDSKACTFSGNCKPPIPWEGKLCQQGYCNGNANLRKSVFWKVREKKGATLLVEIRGLPAGWQPTNSPVWVPWDAGSSWTTANQCGGLTALGIRTTPPACTIELLPSYDIPVGASKRIGPSSWTETGGTVDEIEYDVVDTTVANINPRIKTRAQGWSTTLSGLVVGSTDISVTAKMVDEGVSCPSNPPISTVNVINFPGWFQVSEGGVQVGGRVSSDIPGCSSGTCSDDFIINSTSDPGVAVVNGSIFPGANISSTNWVADTPTANLPGYKWFEDRLSPEITNNWNIITNIDNPLSQDYLKTGNVTNGYRWFKRVGPLTIDNSQDLANEKVILFVDGDLKIEKGINFNQGTGFFMAIVSGDILIEADFPNSTTTEPELEGFYYTDNTFNTDVTIGTYDSQLWIRGSVVANSISLNRDISSGNTIPAELFEYDPTMLLNYPNNLKVKRVKWREVAP